MKWRKAEWRAIVPGVHHHAHAFCGELLKQVGDRWNPIVRVRHHPDSH